jgi:hypothetical protein
MVALRWPSGLHGSRGAMLLKLYLAAYFGLLAIALAVLWRGGVLARLPLGWVALVVVGAVLLGVLLALLSPQKPANPA